jgi:diguanylate cyclase (GGDEF)-like protein
MPNRSTTVGAVRRTGDVAPLSAGPNRGEGESSNVQAARPPGWGERLSSWAFAATEAFRWPAAEDRAVDAFSDVVEAACERSEIEAALVRLAGQIAGAERVELRLEEPSETPFAAGDVFCLPLRFANRSLGMLCLWGEPGRRWSPGVVRQLTTLGTIAAAALAGLDSCGPALVDPDREPTTILRDATFLNAILPYALGQAKRHHEPVSLFCVAIDRLRAIEQVHGRAEVDAAVRFVAETIAQRLRSSDVVARLDDDRVIAVLPDAGASDAFRIAETVRQAIATGGAATIARPLITASIGVANYPLHGRDVESLISAADEAMTCEQHAGRNRVALATPPSERPALTVTPCAG